MDYSHGRIQEINQLLAQLKAADRLAWVMENQQGVVVLSSSFGIQSAVMLHMATSLKPDIPVVVVDTGYLFPETYQFIDTLTERLQLNLHIYRAHLSSAWQEARYGKLWNKGKKGISKYNEINKVEPMSRAFDELDVRTWLSGIRRAQSSSRANTPFAEISTIRSHDNPVLKVHPIVDWDNRDIHRYIETHNLPYHPLWEQGYTSIGDTHTTQKWEPGMSEDETRFFGLTRECGLHGR